MEFLDDRFQRDGSRFGAVADDVVMIGEHCPGFQLPRMFSEDIEEELLKPVAPLGRVKEVGLLAGACCDEIDAGI